MPTQRAHRSPTLAPTLLPTFRILQTLSLVLFSVMVSAAAYGAGNSCPINPDDPFSFQATMPSGPFKGVCIDTNTYRSVRSLTADELSAFQISDKNVQVVANFRHKDHFWIAVIPNERIKDLVFQQVLLSPALPISHGQVRIRMNPAGRSIKLIEQSRRPDRQTITLNEDIVFALFGVRAMGHEGTFNPIEGMMDDYAISYTIESHSQGTDWAIVAGQTVHQYVLNGDQNFAITFLTTSIGLGQSFGLSVPYNTLTNSCLNAVFLALAKTKGQVGPDQIQRFVESADPVTQLKWAGLIKSGGLNLLSSPSQILDLNQEIQHH